ncbi:GLUG motif-containing protein [Methanolapillus millepedarum]|uniref:GLUG domain-containing protein n=1 Tax=Methanolapillus millepedarum TaxID=3028296 RepID=A0AA96VEJ7_9EURY|nr:hypothetical protein MsAc7_07330 [Methanosarcinaceae archaeon Ac7]
MDSKTDIKYKQKKYIPVAIIILLLLLAVFTYVYVQNNKDVNVILHCEHSNASTPIESGQGSSGPVNSSSPDPIHVTPGGNGSGTNPPTPDRPTIADMSLFDYNQDTSKTLRVVLTMNNPGIPITNLSINYTNVNNDSDNGTIAIPSLNIDSTYGPQGTYLVSIPSTGSGNPLSTVGALNTYEYYFSINDDSGISKSSYYPFQSGTGSVATPFMIQGIVQFDALRYYTSANGNNASGKYFVVMEDISFPAEWNNNTGNLYNRALSDGTGWVPIGGNKLGVPSGAYSDQFRGNFNGNNKTFSNFTIRSSNYSNGLFGQIGGVSTDQKTDIRNLKIEKMNVQTSNVTKPSYVGSLSGYVENSTVTNVSTANLTIEGDSRIGGLIGYINNTTVNNSTVKGTITTTNYSVGGVVGAGVYSLITNSTSDTNLTAGRVSTTNNSSCVGGIIGLTNYVDINNSRHNGTIQGYNYTGGIVGIWQGGNIKIENSSHTGDINARETIGGVVGIVAGSGTDYTIKSSNATGNISVGAAYSEDGTGGIIGKVNKNNGTIDNCHYIGTITCTENKTYFYYGIGGIMGYSKNENATISNSSANVEINVLKGNGIGGIVGYSAFRGLEVVNSTARGNITSEDIGADVSDLITAGGLVGMMRNDTLIMNSSASVNIKGKTTSTNSGYGGLVGESINSRIRNSYATGNVSGNKAIIGGLVGSTAGIQIDNCYATGNITGGTQVGGLVGNLAPMVIRDSVDPNIILENISSYLNNSYATGNVSGSNTVGGLVGGSGSASRINNCIALNAEVSGSGARRIYSSTTGFPTAIDIVLTNNYAYDGMTTNANFNEKSATGRDGADATAAQAKTLAFYTGTLDWNDGSIVWRMGSAGYPIPVLTWQTTEPTNPPSWATAP